jgi:HD superfamily phosphohydrolase
MPEGRTIRDPIHRFIELKEQETEIIDSEAFQRLRNLRQLAFAYLVYPSATHTRFEHSLGVCHGAGLLARKLKLTSDETKLVRLAALLHDVGYGPFFPRVVGGA